jgi:tetratricopeptide (TPR) repeat protein
MSNTGYGAEHALPVKGGNVARVTLQEYCAEARSLIDQRAYDQAIAICRHILQRYPKHIRTYQVLGEACLEKGQLDEAADIFKRLLNQADPENFVAYAGLGVIKEEQGKFEEAIWFMERAFELAPNRDEVRNALRRLYGKRDGSEPARIKLNKAALSRLYARGGQYRQAIDEFRILLAADENRDRVDLKVSLAETLWRDGRKEQAAELAREILQACPDCLKAILLLGAAQLEKGRVEEGRTTLDRTRALDPENSVAQALFGDQSPLALVMVKIPRAVPAEPQVPLATATEIAPPAEVEAPGNDALPGLSAEPELEPEVAGETKVELEAESALEAIATPMEVELAPPLPVVPEATLPLAEVELAPAELTVPEVPAPSAAMEPVAPELTVPEAPTPLAEVEPVAPELIVLEALAPSAEEVFTAPAATVPEAPASSAKLEPLAPEVTVSEATAPLAEVELAAPALTEPAATAPSAEAELVAPEATVLEVIAPPAEVGLVPPVPTEIEAVPPPAGMEETPTEASTTEAKEAEEVAAEGALPEPRAPEEAPAVEAGPVETLEVAAPALEMMAPAREATPSAEPVEPMGLAAPVVEATLLAESALEGPREAVAVAREEMTAARMPAEAAPSEAVAEPTESMEGMEVEPVGMDAAIAEAEPLASSPATAVTPLSDIERYRLQLEQAPKDDSTRLLLARAYCDQEQMKLALEHFGKLVRSKPPILSEAVHDVEVIVASRPDNLEAQELLADLYAKSGRLQEAVNRYRWVLRRIEEATE